MSDDFFAAASEANEPLAFSIDFDQVPPAQLPPSFSAAFCVKK
jgi:hypothetical protein